MSDFLQMARRLAPALFAVNDEAFFASVRDVKPGGPPDEPVVEFWTDDEFDDWSPGDDCIAIFGVVLERGPSSRLRRFRKRARRVAWAGSLIYGVSREGEMYAATRDNVGDPLVEYEPLSGRWLDAVRCKFALPPGPPADEDLRMARGSQEFQAMS